ncbi:hypothetical protein RCH14_004725 [Massilia sp. MP_M2]|uniref:hypothetical protein n=1 Tax=Massilia sp. MP_M2 TaxID=3071713 RepID=UPI00319EA7E3
MENDEAIAARLLVRAKEPEQRSKSGRLRTLLPAIEASIAAGLSLEVILAELNSQGLDMQIGSFKSTLYRIRQKKPTSIPLPAPALPVTLTPKTEGIIAPSEQHADEPADVIEESDNLTPKQRREKIADKYVTPQSSNSLLNKFNKKETKQ